MSGPIQTTALVSGLVSAPWWVQWLGTANLVFGTVAAIAGAIIGVVAVWKLWQKHKGKQ